MGFLKTLVVGSLAVLGGCTVVVGGCTVGAAKVGMESLGAVAETSNKNNFDKLYNQNAEKAEAKYIDVATKCYTDTMRLKLGSNIPQHVIDERVNYDIYEIRLKKSGVEYNVKHLATWRAQSDEKIIASVSDKTQRRAIKKYFKYVEKGALLETLCIANDFTPKNSNGDTVKQASRQR